MKTEQTVRGGQAGAQRRAGKPARRPRFSKLFSFTLIELLVVVAIMMILTGLLIGVGVYATSQAKVTQTRALIAAVSAALEMYRADQGAYPPLEIRSYNGDSSAANTMGYLTNTFPNGRVGAGDDWLSKVYFIGDPYANGYDLHYMNSSTNGWTNIQFAYRALASGNKKYMSFSPGQTRIVARLNPNRIVPPGTNYVIVDAWGQPLGYNPKDPKGNPNCFDLWSAGPDLISNSEAYPASIGAFDADPAYPGGGLSAYWFVPAKDDIKNWNEK